MIDRRPQEARRDLRIAQAAHAQQAGNRGMQIQRGRESPSVLVIARQVLPDERFHDPVGPTFRSGVVEGAVAVDEPEWAASLDAAVSMNAIPSSPIWRNFA